MAKRVNYFTILASKCTQYDDLGLRSENFAVGEWLLGFDTCQLRRGHTNGVLQFDGPFLVVSEPVVTGSTGENSHLIAMGTNSGGQDNEQSLPPVAPNGNTGPDVVDGLFQSAMIEEGFCPNLSR